MQTMHHLESPISEGRQPEHIAGMWVAKVRNARLRDSIVILRHLPAHFLKMGRHLSRSEFFQN